MTETRMKEKVVGKEGDNLIVEQIVETKYLYICPNCPGTPGKIPINGIKAEALCALWSCSKVQGLGFLHAVKSTGMPLREAEELLSQQTYFDYLHGRIMKVDFSSHEFDPILYDRDNGPGAASRAMDLIRLNPDQSRVRDYSFHLWAVEKPEGTKCPRCGA